MHQTSYCHINALRFNQFATQISAIFIKDVAAKKIIIFVFFYSLFLCLIAFSRISRHFIKLSLLPHHVMLICQIFRLISLCFLFQCICSRTILAIPVVYFFINMGHTIVELKVKGLMLCGALLLENWKSRTLTQGQGHKPQLVNLNLCYRRRRRTH